MIGCIYDFKLESEYNSTIFRVSSQMELCGETITDEDMLEKNILYLSCIKCAPITSI